MIQTLLVGHVDINTEKLMNEYEPQDVSLCELAFLVLAKILF